MVGVDLGVGHFGRGVGGGYAGEGGVVRVRVVAVAGGEEGGAGFVVGGFIVHGGGGGVVAEADGFCGLGLWRVDCGVFVVMAGFQVGGAVLRRFGGFRGGSAGAILTCAGLGVGEVVF